MTSQLGYVLYEGPSAYDGAPIVSILTGFASSKNPKTGKMLQVWILRSDIAPHLAVKTGQDASVCGVCPLRPLTFKAFKGKLTKPCYVHVWKAPLSVFNAYKRGRYAYATPRAIREAIGDTPVRLGAYGDPASVPYAIFERLGVGSGRFMHTGYTHGWMLAERFDQRYLSILMASVDPNSGIAPENARTFRVVASMEELAPNEIECANTSSGIQCSKCGLCAGNARNAKNIAIVAHGN